MCTNQVRNVNINDDNLILLNQIVAPICTQFANIRSSSLIFKGEKIAMMKICLLSCDDVSNIHPRMVEVCRPSDHVSLQALDYDNLFFSQQYQTTLRDWFRNLHGGEDLECSRILHTSQASQVIMLEIEQKLFFLLLKAKRGSMGVFFIFLLLYGQFLFGQGLNSTQALLSPKRHFQGRGSNETKLGHNKLGRVKSIIAPRAFQSHCPHTFLMTLFLVSYINLSY